MMRVSSGGFCTEEDEDDYVNCPAEKVWADDFLCAKLDRQVPKVLKELLSCWSFGYHTNTLRIFDAWGRGSKI